MPVSCCILNWRSEKAVAAHWVEIGPWLSSLTELEKKMRKLALALLSVPSLALGHGGGLNGDGCHNERSTGGYHCHRSPQPLYTPPPAVSTRSIASQAVSLPAPASSNRSTQINSLYSQTPQPLVATTPEPAPAQKTGVVRGALWKYTSADGIVHYTNVRPANPSAVMLFSYVEISGQMWRVVFTASDGTAALVHTQTVTRSGDYATGWVMFDYAAPQAVQQGSVQSQAEKWSVNCATQRAYRTDTVYYSGPAGSGATVASWSGRQSDWAAVPGTSGDAAIRTICLGPSKSATAK
jgi:hypothetical protein